MISLLEELNFFEGYSSETKEKILERVTSGESSFFGKPGDLEKYPLLKVAIFGFDIFLESSDGHISVLQSLLYHSKGLLPDIEVTGRIEDDTEYLKAEIGGNAFETEILAPRGYVSDGFEQFLEKISGKSGSQARLRTVSIGEYVYCLFCTDECFEKIIEQKLLPVKLLFEADEYIKGFDLEDIQFKRIIDDSSSMSKRVLIIGRSELGLHYLKDIQKFDFDDCVYSTVIDFGGLGGSTLRRFDYSIYDSKCYDDLIAGESISKRDIKALIDENKSIFIENNVKYCLDEDSAKIDNFLTDNKEKVFSEVCDFLNYFSGNDQAEDFKPAMINSNK